MAAVSQALVDFANHHRQPAAPGIRVVATERYQVTLQPDFPAPGPNSVTYIRCEAAQADDLIREVRSIVAPHRLPVYWIVDPETQPPDFAEYLARHDVTFDSEVAVMVLPVEASIEHNKVAGVQIHDGLAEPETFRAADDVNSQAFGSFSRGAESQERRRKDQLAGGNSGLALATVEGEPAGSAGLTLFPPIGALINGRAVMPRFPG